VRAPEVDEVHCLGVDEVVGGGGANRSNFVLSGKILPFILPHSSPLINLLVTD
jgi:hypothetical protein